MPRSPPWPASPRGGEGALSEPRSSSARPDRARSPGLKGVGHPAAVTLDQHAARRRLCSPDGVAQNQPDQRHASYDDHDRCLNHHYDRHRRPARHLLSKRPPILRRYRQCAPGARTHIRVDPNAPPQDFESIAGRYPVFLITPPISVLRSQAAPERTPSKTRPSRARPRTLIT
jgi:hypothetical protein